MKVNRIAAAAAALIMSVSALAVPASAEWVTQGKSVMYTDSDGDYLTGWQKIDGKKYYFSSKGIMRTGWVKFTGGKKYYITKDKGCLTGFKKIGGNRYYFSSSGLMKTGWLTTAKGSKYYFDKNGVMITGEKYPDGYEIDGELYLFGKNGVLKGADITSSKDEGTDEKTVYQLRDEALAGVQKWKAEYERYCKLKEDEFKVRDTYNEYADFVADFFGYDGESLVHYSQLNSKQVTRLSVIVSDICADTGERDITYWSKQDDKDFYYVIYRKCLELAGKYNKRGTDYNDEIADTLKQKQVYVDLYNKYDRQIKGKNK